MNARRQQRDIDKARARLYRWAEERPGFDDALDATLAELVRRAAARLGQPEATVRAGFAQEPLATSTRIFALLDWITGGGATRSKAPLARYVAERGWRESPLGKRWLRLLGESELEYRDVVGVVLDESIRLAPPGRKTPITVAHEPRLAMEAAIGTRAYARVLPMPQGAVIADGVVLMPPGLAVALGPRAHRFDVYAAWAAAVLVDAGHATPPPGRDRTGAGGPGGSGGPGRGPAGPADGPRPVDPGREKLLERIRKLYAMAQETEASPHEAEIALRRCQSLMARFGITEADLETREFATRHLAHGRTTPMHLRFLAGAVAELHDVVFVTGRGGHAEFRGYAIDTEVAALTLEYLLDAVERALSARRRAGDFPAGRSAAYDYRVGFAAEVDRRVDGIVAERRAAERAASATGTALTVRKREIVEEECMEGLVTRSVRARGVVEPEAAEAGRSDGARVSLDRQVGKER